MDNKSKQAIKSMVDRFFEGHSSINHCLDGHWSIAKGGYDLAAQIYHNDIPVCEITYGKTWSDFDIECCALNEESEVLISLVAEVFDKRNISYECPIFVYGVEFDEEAYEDTNSDVAESYEIPISRIDKGSIAECISDIKRYIAKETGYCPTRLTIDTESKKKKKNHFHIKEAELEK